MDPILTPAILTSALTKLLDSAGTAAGAKAWDALKALIARHRGTSPSQPATPEEAAALAATLADEAAADAGFAQELAAWQQSVAGSDNTVNTVTGSVTNLVQGRDFSGPISFG